MNRCGINEGTVLSAQFLVSASAVLEEVYTKREKNYAFAIYNIHIYILVKHEYHIIIIINITLQRRKKMSIGTNETPSPPILKYI